MVITWSGTLYEHDVVANKSGDGWDWSCSSCGERGHSATCLDHWIDIVEAGIQQTRRETGDPGILHGQALRDLIQAGIEQRMRAQ